MTIEMPVAVGQQAGLEWTPEVYAARQAVMDKIPKAYKIDLEAMKAKYPFGTDIRPLAWESGILTPKELEITDFDVDATKILENIKNKVWTAYEVTLAFGKRACLAHQALCCLTNIFLDEALAKAKELDEYYEKTGKLVGPLHGLPYSAKDMYAIAGQPHTNGYAFRLGLPVAEKNCHLIQVLVDAGVVLYCQTTLPQNAMHLETSGYMGETLNPCRTSLTPGGSSGGCSALMGFGGSPMSVGGDIGGSLRCPAANCGIWTLKPSTYRVPSQGNWGLMPGNSGLAATAGPIARSGRDIDLWFTVMISSQPWLTEVSLNPIPWRQPSPTWKGAGNKIRIGIMRDDGNVLPQPPVLRALDLAKEKLEASGEFEVVEYKPWKHGYGVDLCHRLYFADGAKLMRGYMEEGKEPMLPLSKWVFENGRPGFKADDLDSFWKLQAEREAYRSDYLKHFNEQDVDVILAPTGYGTAPVLGTSKYWGYTSIWNVLDYPGAVFPTGLVSSATLDPAPTSARTFMSPLDEMMAAQYIPEDLEGAPVGLQLVGRKLEDEKVMLALKSIDKLLPFKQ